MKEKVKTVPELRFKGFTDDWEQRKLSTLMEFSNGINAPKQNYGKGRKMISVMDILSSDAIKYDLIKNSVEVAPAIEDKNKVESGDLVFVRSSEIASEVGWAKAYLEERYALYSGFTIRGKVKESYNAFFMELSLNSSSRKQIEQKAGGSTRFNVSQSILNSIEICQPKIDEQNKISDFLIVLDSLITLHQRKLELLKELKKAYLQNLFPENSKEIPRVRFSDFTEDWEQCELGNLGNTFTGLSGKTKEDFGHGDASFVTYVNVFGNPIANAKMVESVEIDSKQNEVQFGDVFFTTSSETPEEVGMSSVWLENTENTYLNSFCFGYRPTEKYDPYYLAFMLRSSEIRKKFMFLAQGISRYNISKTKVMEMEVPVPHFDEQVKIGEFFKTLDNTITFHQRKLEFLQQLKKSYLHKMFI